MKIKELLESNKNEITMNCWVSPQGKIIPVSMSHDQTANKILGKSFNIKKGFAFRQLLNKGYIRIGFFHNAGVYIQCANKQIAFDMLPEIIRRLPVTINLVYVEWDHPKFFKIMSLIDAEKMFK